VYTVIEWIELESQLMRIYEKIDKKMYFIPKYIFIDFLIRIRKKKEAFELNLKRKSRYYVFIITIRWKIKPPAVENRAINSSWKKLNMRCDLAKVNKNKIIYLIRSFSVYNHINWLVLGLDEWNRRKCNKINKWINK
jgi:hypothetical protein